jgi:hypothetical protein
MSAYTVSLDSAIARVVDEHVRRALAEHTCQCACSASHTNPQRTAYTVGEVGQMLDLTEAQVRALCLSGDMDSFRAGRYIRIPVEAIPEFKRRHALAS